MPVKGHEAPRLFTPPLRKLTRKTSLGFLCIEFVGDVLGITLLPWQRWVLIHALEIIGDIESGWHFRFRTVVVLVARQNGKTTVGKIIALFFLYMLEASYILGTSQDLEHAEETWEDAVEIAESVPDLKLEIERVSKTNGKKALKLTRRREYKVKAANRKAGRGASCDLALVDELREHQSWDAWAAITKTTLAKPNGLVWCMSNAGDASSIVLRHLRIQAHQALGDPDGFAAACADSEPDFGETDGSLGWFEWSCAPDDKPTAANLAKANPSLGYGFLTERALMAARSTDPPNVFTTECMCQWVTAKVRSMFPKGAWQSGTDKRSKIAPDAPIYYGVDVSADRMHSAIAAVGLRADGDYHGELIAYKKGLGWLQDAFQRLATNAIPGHPVRVAAQAKGAPVSAMLEIIGAIDGIELIPCQGRDVAGWCGRFWDAVNASNPDVESASDVPAIIHIPQPRLDLSAQTALPHAMGNGAWAWDRVKSPEDASPIVALTVAFGAATTASVGTATTAYEDHDLMLI